MDNHNQLYQQVDRLRSLSATASSDDLQSLIDETRTLLNQSKDETLQDLNAEIRKLYRELVDRRDSSFNEMPSDMGGGSDLTWRVNEFSTMADTAGSSYEIEGCIRKAPALLRDLSGEGLNSANRRTVLNKLRQLARASTQAKNQIVEALKPGDISCMEDAKALLDELQPESAGIPAGIPRENLPPSGPGRRSDNPARPDPNSPGSFDFNERLAQARNLFYSADYNQALRILHELRQESPDHQEINQRIAAAEDNLARGVVPDNRVPFEARSSFGRGQSLERAIRYEEAKAAYEDALRKAREGGPALQNWAPAVEALLHIDELIIAQQTRDEGDQLLREDRWSDAQAKFQAVLKMLPEEPVAKSRLKMLETIQTKYENAQVQINMMSGNLVESANSLMDLMEAIRDLRPQMSESKKLRDLEVNIQAKARTINTRLVERARTLLAQAGLSTTVSERRRWTAESARLLDTAQMLVSDDDVYELTQSASAEREKLTNAEKNLNEANRLLGLNTDSERRTALNLLRGLKEYNQDPIFRQLTTTMLQQYLDQAESALRQKQMHEAEAILALLRDEPFRFLGRSEEIWRLERELEHGRRGTWLRIGGIGAGILILLAIILGLTRNVWGPALIPGMAPTPTITATATGTLAPTATITFTPTDDATETPIPLPTVTPYRKASIINPSENRVAAYDGMSTSQFAFWVPVGVMVDIVDEQRDVDGRLWFRVIYTKNSSKFEGWVRGNYIYLPEK